MTDNMLLDNLQLVGNSIFLSEYTSENIEVSKSSKIKGFWSNTKFAPEIFATFSLNPEFKNQTIDFLLDIDFQPNFLVIKGNIIDLWAISSLIEEGLIQYPCFSIIDNVEKLIPFDLVLLNSFNMNYFMKMSAEVKGVFSVKNEILEKIKNKIKTKRDFETKNRKIKEEDFFNKIKKDISNLYENNIIEGIEI